MFRQVFIFFGCVFVLSGCIYNEEPMPEITQALRPGPKVILPPVKKQTARPTNINQNVPRSWVPPRRIEKRWTAIVIHHSGTSNGNTVIFDKAHKESKHWEGVGYDFVIGNGTDSGNGQVEVTFRWREQKVGAHCKVPGNWANKEAIGICLVGDFNRTVPTGRQMRALAKLIRFLQKRYGIAKSRIYDHKTTPGARVTDCPGRKFPRAKLKSML